MDTQETQKTQDFGNILKNARVKKRFSRSKLAAKIGATTAAVCNWENNKRLPSGRQMLELIVSLSINPRRLLKALRGDEKEPDKESDQVKQKPDKESEVQQEEQEEITVELFEEEQTETETEV